MLFTISNLSAMLNDKLWVGAFSFRRLASLCWRRRHRARSATYRRCRKHFFNLVVTLQMSYETRSLLRSLLAFSSSKSCQTFFRRNRDSSQSVSRSWLCGRWRFLLFYLQSKINDGSSLNVPMIQSVAVSLSFFLSVSVFSPKNFSRLASVQT